MNTSPRPSQGLLMDNIAALKLWQPRFYSRFRLIDNHAPTNVHVTDDGLPIPVVDGVPGHDLAAPGAELLVPLVNHPTGLGSPLRRTVVVGFGFGYHLFALVAKGTAPAVVVPDLHVFATALSFVDLRPILPYIELFFADALPDLPRLTDILLHPATAIREPNLARTMFGKLEKHMPQPTGDLEYGIYFGTYRGVTCLKNPMDLMVDQMIISMVRPTLILEIGTLRGGSALYFNDLLKALGGNRRIHTYDIDDNVSTQALEEDGIFVHGGGHDSFDPSIILPDDRVLVIEDSSHSYRNTLTVLERFGPYVSPGSFFIVEDTLAATENKRPHLEGGPIRAIEEFLPAHPEFEVDLWWQNFYGPGVTNCHRGFLRRVSNQASAVAPLVRTA